MPSRQFAHLRRSSRERLATIASDAGVWLTIRDTGTAWAIHRYPDAAAAFTTKRFEVAAAWIQGYIAGQTTEAAASLNR